MSTATLVTGVIGADIHNIGLRILETALEDAGFKVVSLGILATPDEFVRAAVEVSADAILVSSLNGHGELECPGLRGKCQEGGLEGIILYVGGNLVVGKQPWEDVQGRFLAMGYDRVYPAGTTPRQVILDLTNDLAARKGTTP
ncbi:MAG: methylaspartate mutase subunit S [Betaproteobacteria bacterium]|nr:methylaspartate mutase subunit S [Betaproteobacteria bacterium]MBI3935847.1 methylaspartate mutase subunit S [Betaproteobacteria bacterium]